MVDKIILELPADTVGGDILVSTETRERAEQAAAQAEATASGMIVGGTVQGDNLVLAKADGGTVVAGDVRGPKGLDGSNVLPTDAAVAQAIGTPGSETQTQLNVAIADAAALSGQPFSATFSADGLTGTVGQKLTIPTHVSPAGGETTHPSVLAFPNGFAGYRYWMAHTPYPAGSIADEDPNICASHDGVTWEVPAGLTNPIDDAPGGSSYNSDTELVVGTDGKLWLFWRHTQTAAKTETFYLSRSADGITWSPKVAVFTRTYATIAEALSPTFVFEDGAWSMWLIDMLAVPNRLIRWRSSGPDLTGPSDWEQPTDCTITGGIVGKEPWHIQVRVVGGQHVAMLTVCDIGTSGANGALIVLTSDDGLHWEGADRTAIPQIKPGGHDRLYRATFVPEYRDGELVLRCWYSAVLSTASGLTEWNVFETALRGVGAGGVEKVTIGDPVPAGTPANRFIMRELDGAPREVVRNYVTNPSPFTKIDYWGAGYWGVDGAGTATRETIGGPVKGSPAWHKKLFTDATANTTYHAFGSNTIDTIAVTDDEDWIFSAWLYASFPGSSSSIRLLFYNASGAALGGEVLGNYYPHQAGAWERRFHVTRPPAGAVRAALRGYFQNAPVPIGSVTGMSSLMAEPGLILRDYLDGDVSPDTKLSSSWVGGPYESQSILSASASYMQYWDGVSAVSV